MFARIARINPKILPFVIGAPTIALCSYYYSSGAFLRNESSKVFIGDNNWIDLPISRIEEISHDTKRFTFKYPSQDSVSGLVVASALLTKFVTPKGSNVIRPYTPVSDVDEKGSLDLVIKHYPDGKMTNHIFSLKVNDTLSFKGPIPKWKWVPNSFESITLIGGGTGITPLYQLIHAITKNPNDKTKIRLFYSNKTSQDVLMKKELDELQAKYPDQLRITYFITTPDKGYKGESGFISKEFIASNADKPSPKSHVFVCGPPPFMNAYSGDKKSPTDQGELVGILKELGYTIDQVYKF
ncbi:hypothetical protein Kpol_543p67 [Vanderwaltozyma polyspora DSM 70294]|uniref:NADH-cytochrome b5 reductase 2-A n=1 Tax=Vanderwaltozyma polyspora (strain ATCC 22028 / DSM 70294 / BCRC 21397 / CBS 2163 / NBRC 10782 / NRRL Y-8283 / UCD 57-17) TaxID=436907 RepID=MCR1A_VANPO|nr:uncharacterized protein Kpol_543p67 [Vanderwaltozyma polyspora DSM 70294]A7THS1.1 RecName: Full=NADH-cytochrome b5 reductase 2-A; AltName: Full=Mitochondrial cytochrome b reductase A [Vanderwaltozyma polyspora DSM 70294]EDO18237.1 hypothetical protein Kpol_543p67 [Vanderwaltozyma polyspora DSM 70294]